MRQSQHAKLGAQAAVDTSVRAEDFEGISPPGVRDHTENAFSGNSLINCKGNLDTA